MHANEYTHIDSLFYDETITRRLHVNEAKPAVDTKIRHGSCLGLIDPLWRGNGGAGVLGS